MADQATNVIDAGKVIAGLMTSEPEPQTTEEPVEAEAAPVEESQDEDTVNPSDVPYMEQELEEAPAEEAVAEEEATQDINENSEEPSYTVKVDGSEMEVTLDELLRGYQREADYTRKTSELSLEKSRHNDMMQQSQSEINQKLSKLTELTSAAQQELQTEYSNIDFEKLYEDDPVEAARLEHKMKMKQEKLQIHVKLLNGMRGVKLLTKLTIVRVGFLLTKTQSSIIHTPIIFYEKDSTI